MGPWPNLTALFPVFGRRDGSCTTNLTVRDQHDTAVLGVWAGVSFAQTSPMDSCRTLPSAISFKPPSDRRCQAES